LAKIVNTQTRQHQDKENEHQENGADAIPTSSAVYPVRSGAISPPGHARPPGPTAPATEWGARRGGSLRVTDTARGATLAELRPEVAPLHVGRMKLRARRGF